MKNKILIMFILSFFCFLLTACNTEAIDVKGKTFIFEKATYTFLDEVEPNIFSEEEKNQIETHLKKSYSDTIFKFSDEETVQINNSNWISYTYNEESGQIILDENSIIYTDGQSLDIRVVNDKIHFVVTLQTEKNGNSYKTKCTIILKVQ